MQLVPEQPDHEVVVVLVEPVAGEPDVVAEPGPAERPPDAGVLHQDHILLVARQPFERTRPPQRIPDRPRQLRVAHALARALDQRLDEVGLVPDRVRAAEHRVLGLRRELRERRLPEERAEVGHDRVGALAEDQQRDAGRVVDVLVQNGRQARLLERLGERRRVGCPPEGEQLHEEAPIGGDHLAARAPTLLAHVDVAEVRVRCAVADPQGARRARVAHRASPRWRRAASRVLNSRAPRPARRDGEGRRPWRHHRQPAPPPSSSSSGDGGASPGSASSPARAARARSP